MIWLALSLYPPKFLIYNIYMSLVYYIDDILRVLKSRLLEYGYYHYITRARKSRYMIDNWQLHGAITLVFIASENNQTHSNR